MIIYLFAFLFISKAMFRKIQIPTLSYILIYQKSSALSSLSVASCSSILKQTLQLFIREIFGTRLRVTNYMSNHFNCMINWVVNMLFKNQHYDI